MLKTPSASPRIEAIGSATLTVIALRAASIRKCIVSACAAPGANAKATPARAFKMRARGAIVPSTLRGKAAAGDCYPRDQVKHSEAEVDSRRHERARRRQAPNHQVVERLHHPRGWQHERHLPHPGGLEIDRPPASSDCGHRHDHDRADR